MYNTHYSSSCVIKVNSTTEFYGAVIKRKLNADKTRGQE